MSTDVTTTLDAVASVAKQKIGTIQQLLSKANMAILAMDTQGIITESKRSACRMFGYSEKELLGQSVHVLLPPDFRQRYAELLKRFVDGEETERRISGRNEITGYRKNGSAFPLEASITKLQNNRERLLIVTLRDVTERKKVEEELTWRATHDALTLLPNRALIREKIITALQRSRRNKSSVALLFVDIDCFKTINDTHGHEAGDRLLKTVASRLLDQVRQIGRAHV